MSGDRGNFKLRVQARPPRGSVGQMWEQVLTYPSSGAAAGSWGASQSSPGCRPFPAWSVLNSERTETIEKIRILLETFCSPYFRFFLSRKSPPHIFLECIHDEGLELPQALVNARTSPLLHDGFRRLSRENIYVYIYFNVKLASLLAKTDQASREPSAYLSALWQCARFFGCGLPTSRCSSHSGWRRSLESTGGHLRVQIAAQSR